METAEIRRRWLRYFSTRGHSVVPSAPLIRPPLPAAHGDSDGESPFVGSGLVPFLPYLSGQRRAPFSRATSVQKCLRVNDIPAAGSTSRYSTFFQVNGNFSFGDYGPRQAIELAWEMIIRDQSDGGYGLDGDRIWVTVLHDDAESASAWRQVAQLPDERIIRRGPNENYWHADVPGPGGPSTGIHIDRGGEHGPGGGPDADEDRYLRFWALVFLRDRVSGVHGMGNVDVAGPLPTATIGSGMGLERMACLLQGVDNVLEIDAVFPLIARTQEMAGRRYGRDAGDDRRMRVIADHVRAAAMLIGEGLSPDPADQAVDPAEQRGRPGQVLTSLTGGARNQLRALGIGQPDLDDRLAELLALARERIRGQYPELARTEPSAEDDNEMSETSERARRTGDVLEELRQPGPVEFTGFHELSTQSDVRAIVASGAQASQAGQGQTVELVLSRTPFYPESGGQIADEGEITADGARLRVLDVQRPAKGLIVHTAEVVEGSLHAGQEVLASVDREWRLSACQAHSATHVLHAALRQVLGPGAVQSGSYNRPGYLRLDFAWGAALGADTRDEVESVANLALRYDYPVTAAYMTLAQARQLGALALFEDSYDEQVRVVEMGGAWSRELCGGTHVEHTSQIGTISITGESSVGAGVRRIEALVGLDALRHLNQERALVSRLSDVLKVNPAELPDRVTSLLTRLRETEHQLEQQRRANLLAAASDLAQTPADVFGVSVVTHDAGPAEAGDARALVLDVRDRLPPDRPGVVAVSVLVKERPLVVVATNDEARHWGVKAGELIQEAATVLGGGGGGRDDLAQGGGTDAAKVEEALRRIEHSVGERVTSRG